MTAILPYTHSTKSHYKENAEYNSFVIPNLIGNPA